MAAAPLVCQLCSEIADNRIGLSGLCFSGMSPGSASEWQCVFEQKSNCHSSADCYQHCLCVLLCFFECRLMCYVVPCCLAPWWLQPYWLDGWVCSQLFPQSGESFGIVVDSVEHFETILSGHAGTREDHPVHTLVATAAVAAIGNPETSTNSVVYALSMKIYVDCQTPWLHTLVAAVWLDMSCSHPACRWDQSCSFRGMCFRAVRGPPGAQGTAQPVIVQHASVGGPRQQQLGLSATCAGVSPNPENKARSKGSCVPDLSQPMFVLCRVSPSIKRSQQGAAERQGKPCAGCPGRVLAGCCQVS